MNVSVINRKKIITDIIAALVAVASAVALPQIFHAIGVVSGTGAAVGAAFLPMHIPVILAGLFFGPSVGAVTGLLSPVVSIMISGMPSAALLPFIVLELFAYGLAAGFMNKLKINSFVKLFIVQLSGRIVRAIAIIASIYAFGNTALTLASIGEFITAGLFGILLQWALIPMLVDRFGSRG